MRSPARLFAKSSVAFAAAFAALLLLPAFRLDAQKADGTNQDKNLDIQLHLGKDADARKVGLPLYPGARLKANEEDKDNANLALLTEAFGLKLVIAHYDSGDSPAKVIAYYREQLKKYGRVIECHTTNESGGDIHRKAHNKDSKELKCDGDNTGKAVELKVGTEDNQHVVSVEPAETGGGSTFALVYVYARGERGDI